MTKEKEKNDVRILADACNKMTFHGNTQLNGSLVLFSNTLHLHHTTGIHTVPVDINK